jgi:nitrate/nitrite transport system ATP-binding protein
MLLEIREVVKRVAWQGEDLTILEGVDLEVDTGEFVAVVGGSAVASSTLLALLAGLVVPDSGQVRLDGGPLVGSGCEHGLVLQRYTVVPWMSVFENVFRAFDTAAPYLPATLKARRTDQHLRLCKLEGVARRLPSALPEIMRRRLALARALALDPAVLLLEDPCGGLDEVSRTTLQKELARLWMTHPRAVVMTTSDIAEAVRFADRVYALAAGPGATLGPAVRVDLRRPRAPQRLATDPAFHRACRAVQASLRITAPLALPEDIPRARAVGA